MTNTPARISPPGRIIDRELKARNWTPKQLAEFMRVPTRDVEKLLNAEEAVTPRLAHCLAHALGTTAEFWLALEQNYQQPRVQVKPFETLDRVVEVDWRYALAAVEHLDDFAEEEDRMPIQGRSAVQILCEYGVIARRSITPPEDTCLAIVICPPNVWICPSKCGLDGIFFEEYKPEIHGSGINYTKESLFSYTNIDARLDGWNFFSQMLSINQSQKMKKTEQSP